MEKIVGQFDGYTLREVSFDRDVMQLSSWISEDDFHQHLRPAFFLGLIEKDDGYMRPDPRPTVFAMEDQKGTIFYIRIDRAARVNIQFNPVERTVASRARVARALLQGMAALEVGLRNANVSEWVFDTRAPALRTIAKVRLGFKESPHDLVRVIPIRRIRDEQQGAPEPKEQGPREVM